MKPGDRVSFDGRIGTVKALQPGSMVDVCFDDSTHRIERRARDRLLPVAQENPIKRRARLPREARLSERKTKLKKKRKLVTPEVYQKRLRAEIEERDLRLPPEEARERKMTELEAKARIRDAYFKTVQQEVNRVYRQIDSKAGTRQVRDIKDIVGPKGAGYFTRPDPARLSDDGETYCGNPIDGTAYYIVVDDNRNAIATWVRRKEVLLAFNSSEAAKGKKFLPPERMQIPQQAGDLYAILEEVVEPVLLSRIRDVYPAPEKEEDPTQTRIMQVVGRLHGERNSLRNRAREIEGFIDQIERQKAQGPLAPQMQRQLTDFLRERSRVSVTLTAKQAEIRQEEAKIKKPPGTQKLLDHFLNWIEVEVQDGKDSQKLAWSDIEPGSHALNRQIKVTVKLPSVEKIHAMEKYFVSERLPYLQERYNQSVAKREIGPTKYIRGRAKMGLPTELAQKEQQAKPLTRTPNKKEDFAVFDTRDNKEYYFEVFKQRKSARVKLQRFQAFRFRKFSAIESGQLVDVLNATSRKDDDLAPLGISKGVVELLAPAGAISVSNRVVTDPEDRVAEGDTIVTFLREKFKSPFFSWVPDNNPIHKTEARLPTKGEAAVTQEWADCLSPSQQKELRYISNVRRALTAYSRSLGDVQYLFARLAENPGALRADQDARAGYSKWERRLVRDVDDRILRLASSYRYLFMSLLRLRSDAMSDEPQAIAAYDRLAWNGRVDGPIAGLPPLRPDPSYSPSVLQLALEMYQQSSDVLGLINVVDEERGEVKALTNDELEGFKKEVLEEFILEPGPQPSFVLSPNAKGRFFTTRTGRSAYRWLRELGFRLKLDELLSTLGIASNTQLNAQIKRFLGPRSTQATNDMLAWAVDNREAGGTKGELANLIVNNDKMFVRNMMEDVKYIHPADDMMLNAADLIVPEARKEILEIRQKAFLPDAKFGQAGPVLMRDGKAQTFPNVRDAVEYRDLAASVGVGGVQVQGIKFPEGVKINTVVDFGDKGERPDSARPPSVQAAATHALDRMGFEPDEARGESRRITIGGLMGEAVILDKLGRVIRRARILDDPRYASAQSIRMTSRGTMTREEDIRLMAAMGLRGGISEGAPLPKRVYVWEEDIKKPPALASLATRREEAEFVDPMEAKPFDPVRTALRLSPGQRDMNWAINLIVNQVYPALIAQNTPTEQAGQMCADLLLLAGMYRDLHGFALKGALNPETRRAENDTILAEINRDLAMDQIKLRGGTSGIASTGNFAVYMTYNPVLFEITRMFWPTEESRDTGFSSILAHADMMKHMDAVGRYGYGVQFLQTMALQSGTQEEMISRIKTVVAGPINRKSLMQLVRNWVNDDQEYAPEGAYTPWMLMWPLGASLTPDVVQNYRSWANDPIGYLRESRNDVTSAVLYLEALRKSGIPLQPLAELSPIIQKILGGKTTLDPAGTLDEGSRRARAYLTSQLERVLPRERATRMARGARREGSTEKKGRSLRERELLESRGFEAMPESDRGPAEKEALRRFQGVETVFGGVPLKALAEGGTPSGVYDKETVQRLEMLRQRGRGATAAIPAVLSPQLEMTGKQGTLVEGVETIWQGDRDRNLRGSVLSEVERESTQFRSDMELLDEAIATLRAKVGHKPAPPPEEEEPEPSEDQTFGRQYGEDEEE